MHNLLDGGALWWKCQQRNLILWYVSDTERPSFARKFEIYYNRSRISQFITADLGSLNLLQQISNLSVYYSRSPISHFIAADFSRKYLLLYHATLKRKCVSLSHRAFCLVSFKRLWYQLLVEAQQNCAFYYEIKHVYILSDFRCSSFEGLSSSCFANLTRYLCNRWRVWACAKDCIINKNRSDIFILYRIYKTLDFIVASPSPPPNFRTGILTEFLV